MVMASTCSQLFHTLPSTIRVRSSPLTISSKSQSHRSDLPSRRAVSLPSRREGLLLLLTGTTMLKVLEYPAAKAKDIPLFGIRKKIEKVEEKVEEVLKEGIESAEEGILKAEKGIESAEKGIETAEKEIESAVRISGLAQAGAVAAAELFAVVIATSVVNGILGPEGQKS